MYLSVIHGTRTFAKVFGIDLAAALGISPPESCSIVELARAGQMCLTYTRREVRTTWPLKGCMAHTPSWGYTWIWHMATILIEKCPLNHNENAYIIEGALLEQAGLEDLGI